MEEKAGDDGWAMGFQLLDSPQTRLLDLRAKRVASVELVLVAVYCCQLFTAAVIQAGWLGVAYGIGGVVLTAFIGPPRYHPVVGLVRVALAVWLADPLLAAVAVTLWLVELADVFVMVQLHAAGHGGEPVPWRVVRAERVTGLRRLKAEAREKKAHPEESVDA